MLRLSLAIIFTFAVGCATAIPYSPEETCAFDGMILRGITHGTAEGSASAYNFKTGATTTIAERSTSKNVVCTIPVSDIEKKQINDSRQIAEPIVQYNNSLEGKRWITGIGYVLYIIPGVVAKFIYDGEYDDAIKKSQEIAAQQVKAKSSDDNNIKLRDPANESK